MGTTRERTKKEIMDYIRANTKDGKLTKSLIDIARQIGYSNATVHRTLKSLEEQGVIEIRTAHKPTEPNTIVYKGRKDSVDEVMARGIQLLNDVENSTESLRDFLHELSGLLRKENIINVVDIPDSNMQVITVRKDGHYISN